MVYALQAQLAFATEARRDNVATAVETRIAGKPRFGLDYLSRQPVNDDPWGLIVELRFTSRADQEDLQARIDAVATGANAPLAGSYVRIHDCPHDETEAAACEIAAERTW